MNEPHPTRRPNASSVGRPVLFRVLAVLLGISPLLVAEGVLYWGDWGRPQDSHDPFAGFTAIHPLFVADATGRRFEVSPARQDFFRPDWFGVEKRADEFRIFCLGGSTVQGRPYAIQTSFTTWLELQLRSADPRRHWRVVNCGGVSYGSYRLVPILREVLQHEPDLLIVYTGHNEFLEDRTYGSLKRVSPLSTTVHAILTRSRVYCLGRSWWLRFRGRHPQQAERNRALLPAEVDALLDYRGGLELYHRDDARRRATLEDFEFNLRRMAQLAAGAGVPLVLVNPVSNVRDCPPFKFAADQNLPPGQVEQFQRLWEQARTAASDRLEDKVDLLEAAVAINARHAGARFHLGKCYEALARHDEARAALIKAKDEDICPLRILETMHEVIQQVARQTSTPLVDVAHLFAGRSPHGLVGDELMIDHVHPTIHGHQMIADALMDELLRQQVVSATDGWQSRRQQLYADHLAGLAPSYFARGKQRLEGLRRWTRGRANMVPPAAK